MKKIMKNKMKSIASIVVIALMCTLTLSGIGSLKANAATLVSGQDIVNEAKKYLGIPYEYGAEGPNTFDCSGFTSYVYRQAANIEITRTTYTQINEGVNVSYDELKPGDLVFTNDLNHVGIYVSDGMYINAPDEGDVVKISPITSFYAARRILTNNNFKEPQEAQPKINKPKIENLTFDADFYYRKYPDLRNAFGYNKEGLYNHWLEYGIKEGRASSPIFDVKYYLNNNKDLIAAFGYGNYTAAYNHFLTYGYKESSRVTSPVFSVKYYRKNNSDLTRFDNVFLYNHFLTYGLNEGRAASGNFNIGNYKNRYIDLQNAFGDNLKEYCYHYLIYGIKERRKGI